VKRAHGRADGVISTLRKHYEDARDAIERKYQDTRERLGRFYDENRDTIHTAGKVALGTLAATGLGYGAYRLAQNQDVQNYVDDLRRSLKSRWGNDRPSVSVSSRIVHRNRGVDPNTERLLAGVPLARTSLVSQITDDDQAYTDWLTSFGPISSRTPRTPMPPPSLTPPSTAHGPRQPLPAFGALPPTELDDDAPLTARTHLQYEPVSAAQAQLEADAALARQLQQQQQEEEEMQMREFLAPTPSGSSLVTTPGLAPPPPRPEQQQLNWQQHRAELDRRFQEQQRLAHMELARAPPRPPEQEYIAFREGQFLPAVSQNIDNMLRQYIPPYMVDMLGARWRGRRDLENLMRDFNAVAMERLHGNPDYLSGPHGVTNLHDVMDTVQAIAIARAEGLLPNTMRIDTPREWSSRRQRQQGLTDV